MRPWSDVPEEAMGEWVDPFVDEEIFCGLETPEECESCG